MTTVTAVTAFWTAEAVCKTSSRSSRLSRGAGAKVKGAYLRVEIAARQYNPYPLTFTPRRTLAGRWKGQGPFHPAQRRVTKFRRGAGCPFQRAALLGGRQPQLPGAKPPHHPVGRKCAFDGRQAVKSAFALLSQKVTKARRLRGGKGRRD